jgi:opacity protein-like surface antigen
MRRLILTATLAAAVAAPAAAATYPVSGRWGESTSGKPGAIDCSGKRVVGFTGNVRIDSGGSVHAYQNRSVTDDGPGQYRIVDIFSNGQISGGHISYTLRRVDADHIVLQLQSGTVTLQRCK